MKTLNLSGPLVAGLTLLASSPAWAFPPVGVAAAGECQTCATSCGPAKGHCPPYYKHYFEGAPKLKFKHGCPRPICDPCNLPHYGYFQTCWSPWPFPDDWGHCPTPTASQMLPPPEKPLFAPRVPIPVAPAERPEPSTSPAFERPKDLTPPKPLPPMKPELPEPKPLDGDKTPSVRQGATPGYAPAPVNAALTTVVAPVPADSTEEYPIIRLKGAKR